MGGGGGGGGGRVIISISNDYLKSHIKELACCKLLQSVDKLQKVITDVTITDSFKRL